MSDPNVLAGLPVSPCLAQFQDNDATWFAPAALLDAAPSALLRLAGPPQIGTYAGSVDVSMSMLDLNMALRLGYGDMFKVNVAANATMWVAEVRHLLPALQNTTGSAIVNEYWGVAARLLITAYGLKASASMDITTLSAQADVNGTKSSYFVDIIGLPLALQRPMLDLVAFTNGDFDESANALVGSLKGMLGDLLMDDASYAQLKPALLQVDVDLSRIPVDMNDMAASCFTMQNIRKGRAEANAVQNLTGAGALQYGLQVTPQQVGAYYQMMGVSGTPTPTQAGMANAMLFNGA